MGKLKIVEDVDVRTESQKVRLCYSMVFYDVRADQCYEHEVDYLNAIASRVSLIVIVERGGQIPPIPRAEKIFVQKARGAVSRVFEHAGLLLKIRSKGFNVFYSRNSLVNGVLAGLVTLIFSGRNYFWSCGEVKKGWANDRAKGRWISALMNTLMFRMTLLLSDGLITGNETMRRYYRDAFSLPDRKVLVVPNWIRLDRFRSSEDVRKQQRERLGILSHRFVLLFPRSLSARHGTYKLPEVAAKLTALGVDVLVVATGRGELEASLRRAFVQLGLGDRLLVLGGVPNSDMPALYSASDAVIVPSETEGFPRVLLEAMAASVPFVASRVGGVKDVVSAEHDPVLISADNLDGFAAAIARIAIDAEFSKRQIEVGEETVQGYAVEMVVEKFMCIFSRRVC